MKVQADNINGICKVETFEGKILSQEDFYGSLNCNPDSSVICAEIDNDMAEKIEAEYGIH
jgi:hypothetical protein